LKTIGIDIGTTTISAVVMDTEKKQLLAIRTVPNNSFLRTKQEWERIQDGELLVKKARILLDELLEQYPFVEAIGLTGQMHGILYTDEEGQAVSHLYTWQDKSGDQAEFNGESVTAWLKRTYGIPASTGYGLVTHLYHVKKGLVPPGSTSMCTIADYLGMCLTGRKTPLLHASNGASLGFYDTKIWRFQTEIIKDAGMNPALLPKVTAEVEELGLYEGRPVFVSLGDNQASFLGTVGVEEQVWQVNVGTGGQLSVLSGEHFEAPGIEARPYLQKKYILTGAILCAGRAYAILEHFFEACAKAMGLKAEEQYELMERLVKSAGADAGGIRVDTRFQGTRTNPELLGSISGISEENLRPENLVRGFIQGIAGEYYEIYKKISRGLGIKAEKLLASGNGVRKNAALREALESLFQAELTLTDLQEEAACGAALSARYSLRFK
jgi:sugar (pentulose or hexulose) kinase